MKATGIVRRIDDLGRVVIPKEIRRTMHIREGDALEIFTDRDGQLIFKKYSPVGELGTFAEALCESLRKAADCTAAICDTDAIIAVSGSGRRELMDKPVSPRLLELMNTRKVFSQEGAECILPVSDAAGGLCICAAAPVIASGDVCGCVMLLSADTAAQSGGCERALAVAAADFVAGQLEG